MTYKLPVSELLAIVEMLLNHVADVKEQYTQIYISK